MVEMWKTRHHIAQGEFCGNQIGRSECHTTNKNNKHSTKLELHSLIESENQKPSKRTGEYYIPRPLGIHWLRCMQVLGNSIAQRHPCKISVISRSCIRSLKVTHISHPLRFIWAWPSLSNVVQGIPHQTNVSGKLWVTNVLAREDANLLSAQTPARQLC